MCHKMLNAIKIKKKNVEKKTKLKLCVITILLLILNIFSNESVCVYVGIAICVATICGTLVYRHLLLLALL